MRAHRIVAAVVATVLLFSARVMGDVEVVIDCGAIPAGVAGPSISISFQLSAPDCPGGQPPVRGSIEVTGLTSPMAPDALAARIRDSILASPANIRCNNDPAGTGITAARVDGPNGPNTRVEVGPVGASDHISSFQINDNTQATGALKGKNGTIKKSFTVSGTAVGGSVTVEVNPIVTVETSPGQSSMVVLQNISNALTNAGFFHTVVPLPASGLLQGGLPPAMPINNALAIVVPGHLSGEDGLWVQSRDPGLRGVKQVDLRAGDVPTLSQWALIALAAAVAAAGAIILVRRRPRPASA